MARERSWFKLTSSEESESGEESPYHRSSCTSASSSGADQQLAVQSTDSRNITLRSVDQSESKVEISVDSSQVPRRLYGAPSGIELQQSPAEINSQHSQRSSANVPQLASRSHSGISESRLRSASTSSCYSQNSETSVSSFTTPQLKKVWFQLREDSASDSGDNVSDSLSASASQLTQHSTDTLPGDLTQHQSHTKRSTDSIKDLISSVTPSATRLKQYPGEKSGSVTSTVLTQHSDKLSVADDSHLSNGQFPTTHLSRFSFGSNTTQYPWRSTLAQSEINPSKLNFDSKQLVEPTRLDNISSIPSSHHSLSLSGLELPNRPSSTRLSDGPNGSTRTPSQTSSLPDLNPHLKPLTQFLSSERLSSCSNLSGHSGERISSKTASDLSEGNKFDQTLLKCISATGTTTGDNCTSGSDSESWVPAKAVLRDSSGYSLSALKADSSSAFSDSSGYNSRQGLANSLQTSNQIGVSEPRKTQSLQSAKQSFATGSDRCSAANVTSLKKSQSDTTAANKARQAGRNSVDSLFRNTIIAGSSEFISRNSKDSPSSSSTSKTSVKSDKNSKSLELSSIQHKTAEKSKLCEIQHVKEGKQQILSQGAEYLVAVPNRTCTSSSSVSLPQQAGVSSHIITRATGRPVAQGASDKYSSCDKTEGQASEFHFRSKLPVASHRCQEVKGQYPRSDVPAKATTFTETPISTFTGALGISVNRSQQSEAEGKIRSESSADCRIQRGVAQQSIINSNITARSVDRLQANSRKSLSESELLYSKRPSKLPTFSSHSGTRLQPPPSSFKSVSNSVSFDFSKRYPETSKSLQDNSKLDEGSCLELKQSCSQHSEHELAKQLPLQGTVSQHSSINSDSAAELLSFTERKSNVLGDEALDQVTETEPSELTQSESVHSLPPRTAPEGYCENTDQNLTTNTTQQSAVVFQSLVPSEESGIESGQSLQKSLDLDGPGLIGSPYCPLPNDTCSSKTSSSSLKMSSPERDGQREPSELTQVPNLSFNDSSRDSTSLHFSSPRGTHRYTSSDDEWRSETDGNTSEADGVSPGRPELNAVRTGVSEQAVTEALTEIFQEQAVNTVVSEISNDFVSGNLSMDGRRSSDSSQLSSDKDDVAEFRASISGLYPESYGGLSDVDWNIYTSNESDNNITPRSVASSGDRETPIGSDLTMEHITLRPGELTAQDPSGHSRSGSQISDGDFPDTHQAEVLSAGESLGAGDAHLGQDNGVAVLERDGHISPDARDVDVNVEDDKQILQPTQVVLSPGHPVGDFSTCEPSNKGTDVDNDSSRMPGNLDPDGFETKQDPNDSTSSESGRGSGSKSNSLSEDYNLTKHDENSFFSEFSRENSNVSDVMSTDGKPSLQAELLEAEERLSGNHGKNFTPKSTHKLIGYSPEYISVDEREMLMNGQSSSGLNRSLKDETSSQEMFNVMNKTFATNSSVTSPVEQTIEGSQNLTEEILGEERKEDKSASRASITSVHVGSRESCKGIQEPASTNPDLQNGSESDTFGQQVFSDGSTTSFDNLSNATGHLQQKEQSKLESAGQDSIASASGFTSLKEINDSMKVSTEMHSASDRSLESAGGFGDMSGKGEFQPLWSHENSTFAANRKSSLNSTDDCSSRDGKVITSEARSEDQGTPSIMLSPGSEEINSTASFVSARSVQQKQPDEKSQTSILASVDQASASSSGVGTQLKVPGKALPDYDIDSPDVSGRSSTPTVDSHYPPDLDSFVPAIDLETSSQQTFQSVCQRKEPVLENTEVVGRAVDHETPDQTQEKVDQTVSRADSKEMPSAGESNPATSDEDQSPDDLSKKVKHLLSNTAHLAETTVDVDSPRDIDYDSLHRDLDEIQDSLKTSGSLPGLHEMEQIDVGNNTVDVTPPKLSFRSACGTGSPTSVSDLDTSRRRFMWDYGADIGYEDGQARFIGHIKDLTGTEDASSTCTSRSFHRDTPLHFSSRSPTPKLDSDKINRTLTDVDEESRSVCDPDETISEEGSEPGHYLNKEILLLHQQLLVRDALPQGPVRSRSHESTNPAGGLANRVSKLLENEDPQKQAGDILKDISAEEKIFMHQMVVDRKEAAGNESDASSTPSTPKISRRKGIQQSPRFHRAPTPENYLNSPTLRRILGKNSSMSDDIGQMPVTPPNYKSALRAPPYGSSSAFSQAKTFLSDQLEKMSTRQFDQSIELRTPVRRVIDCYPVYGAQSGADGGPEHEPSAGDTESKQLKDRDNANGDKEQQAGNADPQRHVVAQTGEGTEVAVANERPAPTGSSDTARPIGGPVFAARRVMEDSRVIRGTSASVPDNRTPTTGPPRVQSLSVEYKGSPAGSGASTGSPSSFSTTPGGSDSEYSSVRRTGTDQLRPYRPKGSTEVYYTESETDEKVSVADSVTTVESTHPGSDDARGPDFPTSVLGSRREGAAPHTQGVYGTRQPPTSASLSTIEEKSQTDERERSSLSFENLAPKQQNPAVGDGDRNTKDLTSREGSEVAEDGTSSNDRAVLERVDRTLRDGIQTGNGSKTSHSGLSVRSDGPEFDGGSGANGNDRKNGGRKPGNGNDEASDSERRGVERIKVDDNRNKQFDGSEKQTVSRDRQILGAEPHDLTSDQGQKTSQKERQILTDEKQPHDARQRDAINRPIFDGEQHEYRLRAQYGDSWSQQNTGYDVYRYMRKPYDTLQREFNGDRHRLDSRDYTQARMSSRSREDIRRQQTAEPHMLRFAQDVTRGNLRSTNFHMPSGVVADFTDRRGDQHSNSDRALTQPLDDLSFTSHDGGPGSSSLASHAISPPSLYRSPILSQPSASGTPAGGLTSAQTRDQERPKDSPEELPGYLTVNERNKLLTTKFYQLPVHTGDDHDLERQLRDGADGKDNPRSAQNVQSRDLHQPIEETRSRRFQRSDRQREKRALAEDSSDLEDFDRTPVNRMTRLLQESLQKESEIINAIPTNLNEFWEKFKQMQSESDSSMGSDRIEALADLMKNPSKYVVKRFMAEKESERKRREAWVENDREQRRRDNEEKRRLVSASRRHEIVDGSYSETLEESNGYSSERSRDERGFRKRDNSSLKPYQKELSYDSSVVDTLYSIPEDPSIDLGHSPSTSSDTYQNHRPARRQRNVIDPNMQKLKNKISKQRVKYEKQKRKEAQRLAKIQRLEKLLAAKKSGKISNQAFEKEVANLSSGTGKTSCSEMSTELSSSTQDTTADFTPRSTTQLSSELSNTTLTPRSTTDDSTQIHLDLVVPSRLKVDRVLQVHKKQPRRKSDPLEQPRSRKDMFVSTPTRHEKVKRDDSKDAKSPHRRKKAVEDPPFVTQQVQYDHKHPQSKATKSPSRHTHSRSVERAKNKKNAENRLKNSTCDVSVMCPSPTLSPTRKHKAPQMVSISVQTKPQHSHKTRSRSVSGSPSPTRQSYHRNADRQTSKERKYEALRHRSASPKPKWTKSAENQPPSKKHRRSLQDVSSYSNPGISWFVPMDDPRPWRKPLRERQALALSRHPHARATRSIQTGEWSRDPDPIVYSRRVPKNQAENDEKSDPESFMEIILTKQNQPKDFLHDFDFENEKPLSQMTLQEAFRKYKSDVVSRSKARQRRIALASRERELQEMLGAERAQLFMDQRYADINPADYHPLSDNLFKPKKRSMTKPEMKALTARLYDQLPEVVQKKIEEKRQNEYKVNRIRAKMFNKKVQRAALGKSSPWYT